GVAAADDRGRDLDFRQPRDRDVGAATKQHLDPAAPRFDQVSLGERARVEEVDHRRFARIVFDNGSPRMRLGLTSANLRGFLPRVSSPRSARWSSHCSWVMFSGWTGPTSATGRLRSVMTRRSPRWTRRKYSL